MEPMSLLPLALLMAFPRVAMWLPHALFDY